MRKAHAPSKPLALTIPIHKPVKNSLLLVKIISQADMDDQRVEGLCYYCNKKYVMDHRCKKRQIYFLEGKDVIEEDETVDADDNDQGDDILEEPLILVHALVGSLSYQTMRICGFIKLRLITILIDLGITHNFLDPSVAKRTRCSIHHTNPLSVAVVDGSKISNMMVC